MYYNTYYYLLFCKLYLSLKSNLYEKITIPSNTCGSNIYLLYKARAKLYNGR